LPFVDQDGEDDPETATQKCRARQFEAYFPYLASSKIPGKNGRRNSTNVLKN
jgi:hypothetical protein